MGLSWTVILAVFIAFPLFWRLSYKFRYYIKWCYYVFFGAIFTGVFVALGALLRPRDVRNLR